MHNFQAFIFHQDLLSLVKLACATFLSFSVRFRCKIYFLTDHRLSNGFIVILTELKLCGIIHFYFIITTEKVCFNQDVSQYKSYAKNK